MDSLLIGLIIGCLIAIIGLGAGLLCIHYAKTLLAQVEQHLKKSQALLNTVRAITYGKREEHSTIDVIDEFNQNT
jgi:hypothetical protein